MRSRDLDRISLDWLARTASEAFDTELEVGASGERDESADTFPGEGMGPWRAAVRAVVDNADKIVDRRRAATEGGTEQDMSVRSEIGQHDGVFTMHVHDAEHRHVATVTLAPDQAWNMVTGRNVRGRGTAR